MKRIFYKITFYYSPPNFIKTGSNPLEYSGGYRRGPKLRPGGGVVAAPSCLPGPQFTIMIA